jgi:hypothetical protein
LRNHLLRFLRLIAKDIVRRLAEDDATGRTQANRRPR